MLKNPFKPGDPITFKDGDKSIYFVHTIYTKTKLSLGLHDYPNTEMDFQIDIKNIKKIKTK